MNRYLVSAMLTLVALSLPFTLQAKGNGPMNMQQPPIFTDIDLNQDGVITEQEFTDFQQAKKQARQAEGRLMKNANQSEWMFERIDTNQDQIIDEQEFQAHRGTMRRSNS
ncbi:hypothetical protein FCU94_12600 [Vibrio sp. JPW-9-11-11]|uniref:hypothetical protein n=1 Tax=Vibrio sp. JPW-9-11-11 TaxID=1416532 RepID=UPI001593ADB7|nr:hypothetical protein [Vibrio sp. JPW-9-11-11]NVD07725.1 hypothetical protein [Vibrio sp. JPW-9-11-11]